MEYEKLLAKLEEHHPAVIISLIFRILEKIGNDLEEDRRGSSERDEILIMIYSCMGILGLLNRALREYFLELPELKTTIN